MDVGFTHYIITMNDLIDNEIKNFLFVYDVRWSGIHTRIINRMMITAKEKKFYEESIGYARTFAKAVIEKVGNEIIGDIIEAEEYEKMSFEGNCLTEYDDDAKTRNEFRAEQRATLQNILKGL